MQIVSLIKQIIHYNVENIMMTWFTMYFSIFDDILIFTQSQSAFTGEKLCNGNVLPHKVNIISFHRTSINANYSY